MKTITAALLSSITLASVVFASGTYRPPRPPIVPRDVQSAALVDRGRELFEGTALTGRGGRACNACHDSVVPLRRSSLQKAGANLPALINREITHPERTAAARPLERSSTEMAALGAYLIARYRLPRDYMRHFPTK